jgi:hypothetical protein
MVDNVDCVRKYDILCKEFVWSMTANIISIITTEREKIAERIKVLEESAVCARANLDFKARDMYDYKADGMKEALAALDRILDAAKKDNVKHECSFGFDKGQIGENCKNQEPQEGQRGFSAKREDLVCKCGKTRREWLA